MIRRPPRSTQSRSSAASDVYKRQHVRYRTGTPSIQVSGANFRVYVDLLGLGPGIHRRVPVLCQSDPGITCASVTPRFITVAMDFLKQEQSPVTPVIVGQPPKGY